MNNNNTIQAIIGLGNPGPRFFNTRHNIGFRVLDALAKQYGASFKSHANAEIASIEASGRTVVLIKPQTFMNSSGQVAPLLQKKGITADKVLVVHDELEIPFGVVKTKMGGSAKGHNGLRSLIAHIGPDFLRVRCGIGRPLQASEVPDYVLAPFKEPTVDVEQLILNAVSVIEAIIQ